MHSYMEVFSTLDKSMVAALDSPKERHKIYRQESVENTNNNQSPWGGVLKQSVKNARWPAKIVINA